MGHSTSSGRTTEEPARRSLTNQAPPRFDRAEEFNARALYIIRNLEGRLSIVNDRSDLDIVKNGDNEYRVTRTWQEDAPNGGYYSRRQSMTMTTAQAAQVARDAVSEQSTVRLGNETLVRRERRRR